MTDEAIETERTERRDLEKRMRSIEGAMATLSPPVFWLKCVTWGLVAVGAAFLWLMYQLSGYAALTTNILDSQRYDKKEETSRLQDMAGWKAIMEYKVRTLIEAQQSRK